MDKQEILALLADEPVAIAKRKHPLAKCEECPLAKERMAPTCGPADAKVAVVSRSPGKYDVIKKRPFAGESGKVLDHLLGLYGVKREEVILTNVVLCKTEDPPTEAIAACRPRLRDEIKNADTVLAAGAEPVRALTGRSSLAGSRGYVHERTSDSGKRQRIVAANNPALVLRDDSAFPNLVKDFRLALAPLPPATLPDVDWTNDIEQARRWLSAIQKQKIELLSIDIESKGLRADAPIVAVGFSATGSKAISFGERPCNDRTTVQEYLRPLISKSRSLYHNGKFDVRNFRQKGINARVDEDTMLLSWALDERSDEEAVHKLEYLLMNELNWPNYEPKAIVEWKRKVKLLEKQLKFEELYELPTPDELYEYNALDAAGPAQLFPILRERAISDNVYDAYRNTLIPASEALVRIELNGVNFDTSRALDMLEEDVWPKLDDWREELRLIVGDGDYNPNSSKQNAELVYDDWQIIHTLPTKKERTVDKSVYTEIKAGRFVRGTLDQRVQQRNAGREDTIRTTAIRWATKFADFKELDKQRSTYLEGLIPIAIYNGGKLYTNFKLHNTVSGRLSSSNPNLQNITRPKPGLPNIRSLFVAGEGRVILECDYSQAELRALAALSGDKGLAKIYRERLDLHSIAAERFYGVGFTNEQRQRAKNMNFGVPYGQSAATFQEKHDVPVEEGEQFIEWWFANFSGVTEWRKEVAKAVTTVGEVVSPFGFKRRFHLITKENRNAAIREGINFLPQNIAHQFTLWSLIQLVDSLPDSAAYIIIEGHDSIILSVDANHVDDVARMVKSTMVSAPKKSIDWDFPFEVEFKIGPSWGELKSMELAV